MRSLLTEKDKKDLKYQCRMGYIIPLLMFILGSVILVAIYESNFNSNPDKLNIETDLLIVLGVLLFSILVSYLMNRKYYSDIRNNVKVSVTKTIQRKMDMKDFEAGSGNRTSLPHNNPMKEFIRYDLLIDSTKYRVDKELFDKCSDGDKVLIFYAPKSNFRLSIQKKSRV